MGRTGSLRWLLAATALGSALALGGCGGGGGAVQSTPTPQPAPAPTPAPSPAPTPAPTSFQTAEYNRSTGVVLANVLPAYQAGATGQGIVAGVIDSGVDVNSAEFAGRISSASADLDGNRGLADPDGHGTAVSSVLLGAKNDSGTHGVAFGATLLVLRTDEPGSCATANPDDEDSGCQHSDAAIARAVDLAVSQNARVINISLGGSPPAQVLRQAVARATSAGVVIVISAGNDSEANPDPFARIANDAAIARGQVIIAGSVDGNQALSSFSNRAGADAAFFLTALGSDVRAPGNDGRSYLWSGTSFAAPHIAGAVALLAEAFPNLTGAQIVELLYSTATDLGATGVDSVYGRGMLNIGRAFQPQGQTSLAGSRIAVALTGANASLSAPMGDAGQQGLGAVILDGFDRAYAVDLAASIRAARPSFTLAASLQGNQRSLAAAGGDATIALSIAQNGSVVTLDPLTLSGQDAMRARATAAMVSGRIDARTGIALGISQSSAALTSSLRGGGGAAFLIARDPTEAAGFDKRSDSAFAIRRQAGRTALWAAVEQGDALLYERPGDSGRGRYQRHGYASAAFGVDRRFGPLLLGASATNLVEKETVLGASFGPAFGGGRGNSWFVDLQAGWALGGGWTLDASIRQGWTRVGAGGVVEGAALLRSNAFALDLSATALLDPTDRFGFRLSQPLRVSAGGFDVALPTGYDYDSGVTAITVQRLNLAPDGREVDAEASYARDALGGRINANLFYRRDPGNYAAMPDDLGAAVRFTASF
ncbi:MAG: hypothetical protein ABS87_05360 [Sphingomonas sp. SCN 67-18]|nr:MAG: hypothetical protein ABS87_05360 [Sphingomonas sp. SCN 67-18]